MGPLSEEEKLTALRQVVAEARTQYEKGGLLACIATVQGMTTLFDPKGILKGPNIMNNPQ